MYQEDVDLRSDAGPSNDSDWNFDDEKPEFEASNDWELSTSVELFAARQLESELSVVVSKMAPKMQALYKVLVSSENRGDAQKMSGLPQATFYDQQKILRLHLEAHGILPPSKKREKNK